MHTNNHSPISVHFYDSINSQKENLSLTNKTKSIIFQITSINSLNQSLVGLIYDTKRDTIHTASFELEKEDTKDFKAYYSKEHKIKLSLFLNQDNEIIGTIKKDNPLIVLKKYRKEYIHKTINKLISFTSIFSNK